MRAVSYTHLDVYKRQELDSVETSAEVTENGQKTTEQHKFYRYSKSTAEGTTNP